MMLDVLKLITEYFWVIQDTPLNAIYMFILHYIILTIYTSLHRRVVQRWSLVKLFGGEVIPKTGDFREKNFRGASGAAKNCHFYPIFRRYWGGGAKPDFAPLDSALGGGILPPCPPPEKCLWGPYQLLESILMLMYF